MSSAPPYPNTKPNGGPLSRILDIESEHDMDVSQDPPEEPEAENDSVAKDGYCVECEGALIHFITRICIKLMKFIHNIQINQQR
jgi:hypothetical protein